MKKILLYLFVLITCSAYGQVSSLSSLANLKNLDPEMMTDGQVEQVLTKMQTEGYSTTQFDQYAEKQGLDKTTTAKFKNRIVRYNTDVNGLKKRKKMDPEELKKFGLTPESADIDPRLMKFFEAYMEKQDSIKQAELPVFGASMFQELTMSFETNLRMATPESYILGPDDEVVLDIYGLSEGHFNLQVTPEGIIRIPNVGVVAVSGLSIAEAKQSIQKSLTPYYAGINSGETKLSIALGDIRSITVNVIGEVKYPGTYTIPSLATVYNALYQSGGPAENGSFRMVNIIRGGKVIETVDLYDFLVFGKETNVRLQDQDAIKVLPYKNRVSIGGEVKNKALFEVKDDETLADLIKFAGGFTEKAFQERITAYRNTTKEKSVIDVSAPEFDAFIVKAGDAYMVGEILERFSNRVQIQGSVYRPGEYALTEGMKASDLLRKAEGMLDDAFASRAIVFRKDINNLPEIASFSPIEALSGKNDLLLQREDSIQIYSIVDMKEEEYIYVAGEVVKPDKYVFSKGMTLKDAILIAQGVSTKADKGEVEVFRQVTDPTVLADNLQKAKSFKFQLDQVLAFGDDASEFKLQKEDRIIVRSMFGFEDMKQIKIEGEVMRKGTYVITSKNQRVSDVIKMAGGLTQFGYSEGAFLLRRIKKSDAEREMLTEMNKNMSTIGASKIALDEDLLTGTAAKKKRNQYKNSITNPNDTIGFNPELSTSTDLVGIDLKKILANPGSKYDIIMEEGDILSVPKLLETVQVMGEVMMPNTVRYEKGRSLKSYVNAAGGFGMNAKSSKSYVIHANGSIDVTSSFLGFRNYPTVKPGSRVIVPEKPVEQKLTTVEILGITTSITSVAAMIISLFIR